jgi:uncharacterized protein
MNTKLLIAKLETIVKQKMSGLEGTAHSFKHVQRVTRIAVFLAQKEGADIELVQVGALLHDVGWSLGQLHSQTGAELACQILKGLDYPQEQRAKAIRIVLLHPVDFRDRLETLEEKIVWDADKIDLLGAVGVARGFHWLGKKPFEETVKLAYETYTPIYAMLNTATARRIAKKRRKETMAFLSALKNELSLTDLGLTRESV